MDHEPTGDTTSEIAGARRKRMRAHARGLRHGTPLEFEGFRTPQWLDHSFVLPLAQHEVMAVPSQSVPHHDDYEAELVELRRHEPAPVFVRPPTPEIDFARAIRRADLSRTATRALLGSTGLAGVLLIVYLLTFSSVVLGMVIAFACVALVALGVRVRMTTVPIPHL